MFSLSLFHPIIQDWFTNKFPAPTEIQEQAWPVISEHKNVLITAPTGSGKTLTAFLWSIQQLLCGEWEPGSVRVLYISPLKALNNDVQSNLITPLTELTHAFNAAGIDIPAISTFVRSGDTPAYARQKMLRRPPEVLITTPESLNILLTSKNARKILGGVKTLILDEIHAVADSKRGTYLMSAVERLTLISGEFQRIGISATVKPLDKVARFMGGYKMLSWEGDGYEKRQVEIIQSTGVKEIDINIEYPELIIDPLNKDSVWENLAKDFKKKIAKNQKTLIFVNTRRLAEKLTLIINENEDREIAYSHHGSLSKEIREVVEHRLKHGNLEAIVATNSLELGIDIGELDEVILAQAPKSIASGIQKVGRAGHNVGDVSRGALFPTFGMDVLQSVVISRCIRDKDIEPLTIPESPLDVLSQILLSMTSVTPWDIDELYSFIRVIDPFHNLSRRVFDSVLDMLEGRYADTRIAELKPRLILDKVNNTVVAKDSVKRIIYMSGGTIPDRGYYALRHHETGAKIGELDEEFVWERGLGDAFTLGAQSWKITKIDNQSVYVIPWKGTVLMHPFWKAEKGTRKFYFSEKILAFMEEYNDKLDDSGCVRRIMDEFLINENGASELVRFLQRQKDVTGADLPHRHHVVIEHFFDPHGRSDVKQIIIHTMWGDCLNQPFALALAGIWEEKFGYPLETFTGDDNIVLILPHDFEEADFLSMVTPENLETALRRRLEQSGFFGASFRENAGRALLLPKKDFNKRMPLWLNRLRSKKLLSAVMKYQDFPILLETWRSCLKDYFDLENLVRVLEEISLGEISVSKVFTEIPSPFCADIVWRETNLYMYLDDSPLANNISGLDSEILKEVAFSSHLRPEINKELCDEFQKKLQRTLPGYEPGNEKDLISWVYERLCIPLSEWNTLIDLIEEPEEVFTPVLKEKIICTTLPGADEPIITVPENLIRIITAFFIKADNLKITGIHGEPVSEKAARYIAKHGMKGDDENDGSEIILEWLGFYTPVKPEYLKKVFGLEDSRISSIINTLSEDKKILVDTLTEGAEGIEICEAEIFNTLLKLHRRYKRNEIAALPVEKLQLYLATWQGLINKGREFEDLQNTFEQLFGYTLPAALWEKDILPARLESYHTDWLENLIRQSELVWFGKGKEKVGFAFSADVELFCPTKGPEIPLFPGSHGKYGFWDIKDFTGLTSTDITERLWQESWKGTISSDSFEPLRKGILNGFKTEQSDTHNRHISRRTGFNRWQNTRPLSGSWFPINPEPEKKDPLAQEEENRDRVRQLFTRYGILFRQILHHELPSMKWSHIFKTLRIMELSGEIIGGHFFEGIPGLQFMSQKGFLLFQKGLPEDSIYWLNAVDPISLSGIQIEEIKSALPKRLVSNYTVFHGTKPVLFIYKGGKELTFQVPPDDKNIPGYLKIFKDLATRSFDPLKKVKVEIVNGERAGAGVYKDVLTDFGFRDNYKEMVCWF